jgi:hypothetical protein
MKLELTLPVLVGALLACTSVLAQNKRQGETCTAGSECHSTWCDLTSLKCQGRYWSDYSTGCTAEFANEDCDR